jgi:hypothetical protein
MLADLRANVGEGTAVHWADTELIRKLNAAQKILGFRFSMAPGDWLVESASVTPSSGIITLPAACAKPVYLEETSSGREVPLDGNLRDRRITRPSGSSLFVGALGAYPLRGSIEVNLEDYSEACTLWYQRRVADMHAGTADDGGSKSISFETDNDHSLYDDYYNDLTLEVVGGTGASTQTTIDDYTGSSGTATTLAGTFSSSSIYGTVSILPEECHHLIVLEATLMCLAKPSSALDSKYFEYFMEVIRNARKDVRDWIATRVPGTGRVRTTEFE